MTEDKSLLRCTAKKSWSLLSTVIKAAAYATCILGALAISWFVVIAGLTVLQPVGIQFFQFLAGAYQTLAGIPWYCYAGVLAIAAIPVYSLLWCVERELTDEDWESAPASSSTLVFGIFTGLAGIVSGLSYIALIVWCMFQSLFVITINANQWWDYAAALGICTFIVMWLFDNDTDKTFGFPGAVYHHYFKKVP